MPATKKTSRKQALTPAKRLAREKAIIADLRAGKLSYRQIAAKHQVSLPTVNSKARKANITRSRRGPAAVTRKTAGRPAGQTTARAGTTIKARAPRTTARKKAARKVNRKTTRKTTRAVARRGARSGEQFQQRFRELVMAHYPNMSLRHFDKLNKAVEKALS